MVLERRVGKPRGFLRGLALTVVSFGIYHWYWLYKAHNEIFQQFELGQDGRDDAVLFLVVGFFLAPLKWIYQYKFVENLNLVRGQRGLGEGVSAMEFLLWVTVGWLILVGPVVGYYKLQTSINEVWHDLEAEGGEGAELERVTPEQATA